MDDPLLKLFDGAIYLIIAIAIILIGLAIIPQDWIAGIWSIFVLFVMISLLALFVFLGQKEQSKR